MFLHNSIQHTPKRGCSNWAPKLTRQATFEPTFVPTTAGSHTAAVGGSEPQFPHWPINGLSAESARLAAER